MSARSTTPRATPRRVAPRSAPPVEQIVANLVRSLTAWTKVLKDPSKIPGVLIELSHALAGKPKEVHALAGLIGGLLGGSPDLPFPAAVLKFADDVAAQVQQLEAQLDEEETDATAIWLTLTVVSPSAVKVTIGWFEEGVRPSDEMESFAFRDGILPCRYPVLGYLLVSNLVDDPEYCGYSETLQ